ncbi:MAG: hypothetical protein KF889_18150 [Alphaproteobacteria bacterium]|nr:hypothetical protein [Alphaproteobacteria bacterium]MCW5744010.1 hypothetical protein [Alphaproteobacteria bacterium]
MIDRDSYAPGGRGRDAFMSDARALLEMVASYAAHDLALDRVMASSDAQRLVDSARRAIAASAVDELATLADLMADIAHDLGLPIEVDLRAARRLIDMTHAEASNADLPALSPVEGTLFDPSDLPEFRSWRHHRRGQ